MNFATSKQLQTVLCALRWITLGIRLRTSYAMNLESTGYLCLFLIKAINFGNKRKIAHTKSKEVALMVLVKKPLLGFLILKVFKSLSQAGL